jgi:hypothetical protein
LRDNFVETFTLQKTVVFRASAVEFFLWIEYSPQQIWRQQSAFGTDRVKVIDAARHGQLNFGNRT